MFSSKTMKQVVKGGSQVGAGRGKNASRAYRIEAKDFTQAYQSDPVPVTWGLAKRAGVYIFPVFAFRGRKVTQKVGK